MHASSRVVCLVPLGVKRDQTAASTDVGGWRWPRSSKGHCGRRSGRESPGRRASRGARGMPRIADCLVGRPWSRFAGGQQVDANAREHCYATSEIVHAVGLQSLPRDFKGLFVSSTLACFCFHLIYWETVDSQALVFCFSFFSSSVSVNTPTTTSEQGHERQETVQW